MRISIILSTLVACSQAARLTLNGGELRATERKCGLECLQELDCSSQASVDSFTLCIESQCEEGDTSVAHAVERFMSSCHTMNAKLVEEGSLTHLKNIYVSSQMAILKRQADATGNSTSSNGTNSTNSSSSSGSGTGTTSSGASTTRTGTYATSCSSLADILDGTCIVRSSEANHKARNSILAVLGAAALVAYII